MAVANGSYKVNPVTYETDPVLWLKSTFSEVKPSTLKPKQTRFHRFPSHIFKLLNILSCDGSNVISVPEGDVISHEAYTPAFESWLCTGEVRRPAINNKRASTHAKRLYALGIIVRELGATSLEDVLEMADQVLPLVRNVHVFKSRDMPVVFESWASIYGDRGLIPFDANRWLVFGSEHIDQLKMETLWETHMESLDEHGTTDSLYFTAKAGNVALGLGSAIERIVISERIAVFQGELANQEKHLGKLEESYAVQGTQFLELDSKLNKYMQAVTELASQYNINIEPTRKRFAPWENGDLHSRANNMRQILKSQKVVQKKIADIKADISALEAERDAL